MIIIIGLVILVAAVVVGLVAVLSNAGSGHALDHPFAVLGYHVTGSAGTLFLYGIVVGAVGLAGLSVLLAGARRTSRRGHEARRGLRRSRRETAAVSQDRDDLIDQRETARARTASATGDPGGSVGHDRQPSANGNSRPGHGVRHLFGHQSASPQAAVPAQPPSGQSAADSPPAHQPPEIPVRSNQ